MDLKRVENIAESYHQLLTLRQCSPPLLSFTPSLLLVPPCAALKLYPVVSEIEAIITNTIITVLNITIATPHTSMHSYPPSP
ncbi:hypothetical protein E2C01_087797 [Portunus trituberculatus]|uniref:Uncharacterized protein n=1 Tax=Portunus trituberculatus TaxID=210409 RepID=A0A5B7JEB6_PORTR|nr:hypothetical protein [Portunus trituberculatus]